jgi:predicted ribosomally synthesized peptide with nif11-like leader
MSVDSCRTFLERTQRDADFGRLLRVVTDPREMVALGRRHGYSFDLQDIAVASATLSPDEDAPPPVAEQSPGPDGDGETKFCHYEFDLTGVAGMEPILAELPSLTVKPAGVDLEAYRASFREDDLRWTSMSPAEPVFKRRYEEIMADDARQEHGRRAFHLVNLDQYVDDPLYEGYFDAKMRLLGHLEQLFGPEVRFSGSMWYPPFAYRLWHTNETQPGWRMYLLDFDEEIDPSDNRSFFRYMNPQTTEIVTLQDRPRMLRFFKVEQAEDRLFWHCIVNGAERNRWAFGFVVPDDWQSRLPAEAAHALSGASHSITS